MRNKLVIDSHGETFIPMSTISGIQTALMLISNRFVSLGILAKEIFFL